MHINIVLLAPPNYPHVAVFSEVIDLYHAHIQDLGHFVSRTINRFKKDALNLVFGYNLLEHLPRPLLDFDYVICQFEPLGFEAGWNIRAASTFEHVSLPLLRHARQVWDFSTENIAALQHYGIEARHIPLGYHRRLEQVQHIPEKDFDVLYYGSTQPRRYHLLKELERQCRTKLMFGSYGAERDQWIGRTKIVLNIHGDDRIHTMEQVRIFYLLINQCFVLTETCSSNPYGDGLVQIPYDALIPTTLEWLEKDNERQQVIQQGYYNIQQLDMRGCIEQALAVLA